MFVCICFRALETLQQRTRITLLLNSVMCYSSSSSCFTFENAFSVVFNGTLFDDGFDICWFTYIYMYKHTYICLKALHCIILCQIADRSNFHRNIISLYYLWKLLVNSLLFLFLFFRSFSHCRLHFFAFFKQFLTCPESSICFIVCHVFFCISFTDLNSSGIKLSMNLFCCDVKRFE